MGVVLFYVFRGGSLIVRGVFFFGGIFIGLVGEGRRR